MQSWCWPLCAAPSFQPAPPMTVQQTESPAVRLPPTTQPSARPTCLAIRPGMPMVPQLMHVTAGMCCMPPALGRLAALQWPARERRLGNRSPHKRFCWELQKELQIQLLDCHVSDVLHWAASVENPSADEVACAAQLCDGSKILAASRLRIRAKPSSNFTRWAAEATHRQKPMYLTLHQKLACHDTDTSMVNAGGLASASGRTGPLPHQPGTHVAPREAVYRPSRFAQERDSVPPQPHFEHDTPFREAPVHAQPPSGRTSRPSARFFDSEAEYGDAGRLDAGMRL